MIKTVPLCRRCWGIFILAVLTAFSVRAAAYYDAARTAPGGDFENDPEYYLLAARYNLLSGDEEYSMNILTRLSSSSANGRLRLEALRLLTGVAESRKDYREALALSERACDLEDSLFGAWKLDNALQLSAFYKERELRGEIVGNEVKIRFQRIVILFAFLLVALLSALVGFAMMSNKAIKRKNLAMAKLIEEYRDVEKTVSASNPEKAPEEDTSVESAAPDCWTEADRADYMALRDLVRRERLFLDPNLTRDRAVQLSGMNRNRLAKVIQEYSGTNFSGFINLMRLEYSLALLAKRDSTVETVALDSGFGNVRTYHRLFKERFGMTPTEYREASARLRRKSGQGVPGALAIIACLFLAMPPAVHAQECSYMEQLSVDEGLPHTDVSAIVQDADGYIWIGTYSGLCRYDGNSMTVWDMSNSILESSRIRSLFLSDDGLLYIGTETGGLTIFNTLEDRFVKTLRVPSNYVNSISLSPDGHSVLICTDDGLSELSLGDGTCDLSSLSFGSPVTVCYPLGDDEFLLGTPSELDIFSRSSGKRSLVRSIFATSILPLGDSLLVTSYEGCWIFDLASRSLKALNANPSKSACVDRNGHIYVGTVRDGLLCYDSVLGSPRQILTDWRRTPEISCLCFDRSDVLWEGTVGGGCYKSNANSRRFRLFSMSSGEDGEQVVAMMEDSQGRLWLSSRDGDVAVMDDGGRMRKVSERSLARFAGKTVSAFWQAPDGSVWVGAWDRGVIVIPASEVDRAASGGNFRFIVPAGLPEEMSVYKIAADSFGRIWIVTGDGLYHSSSGALDNPVSASWDVLRRDPLNAASLSDDCITDIFIEDRTVWVGSRSGLNRVSLAENGEIEGVERLNIRSDAASREFVSFIYRAGDGKLWVSALGLGLCRMEEDGSFRIFNKTVCPEFPNNEFESVLEDEQGNLWLGGFGLVKFSPATGSVSCFSRSDGLQSNAFKMYDAVRMRDGSMAFGGINGFNVFFPSEIEGNPEAPQVQLTSLLVNAQPFVSGSGEAFRRGGAVRLRSGENNLVLRFSAMHYVRPERNRFRYRMAGLDEDWHLTDGTAPFASYRSLRPGRYRFEVYASNSDGLWSDTPAGVDISILPPWYASVPAKVAYSLALLLSCVAVGVFLRRRSLEEHRRELDAKLRQEERERNENELKFHTDFLHEIRTPLTLITTPVEELLKNPNLGKTTLSRLRLVDQSAKILQKHIESITDLRKYDNGAVRLHIVEIDFSRFVEEICLLFQPVAKARGYEFSIDTEPLAERVYVDKDGMEKVILNLMSNAVKYSPEMGGKIDVKVSGTVDRDGRKGAELTVSNLGIGILPEDLPYIFDRFRQGKNNDRGGMGIGLSLSRSTVLAHSGRIWAESVPGGVTTFHVFLPYGCGQFSPDQIDRDYENSDHLSNYDSLAEFQTALPGLSGGVERDHLVLIVDDSAELREYLTQLLSSKYNIITAKDGLEGYEKAISEQPDLVLTDVVMPQVNGLELCRKIKENTNTSHIPVILISARDLPVYKMEGYQMLADDYVTKPFHAELLVSRIDNLIRQRECMRQSFRTQVNLEPSAVTATPVDEKFIRSCIENIEEHIGEADYGVDELCQNVGYSRPQLYRKIKSITGLSAIQFLRSIRLKRAAQLLSSGSGMSVSEVMYAVGFNNISYFSKIFSAEFGVLPKDYKGTEKQ